MAFRETVSDLPKAESTISPQWAHSKLTKTDDGVLMLCSARRSAFELSRLLLSGGSNFKKHMALPIPFPDLILPTKKVNVFALLYSSVF